MDFVTVRNGVITGVHNGDATVDLFNTGYYGHEIIEIPAVAISHIMTGDILDYYTDTWERKPDRQLVGEGLMAIPAGYVMDGDYARRMTDDELVVAGLKAPPQGHKVDGGRIVPMTIDELLHHGQITKEQHREQKLIAETDELNRRLAEHTSIEAQARALVDEEYDAARKQQISALLATKTQPNWPISVVWPD